MVPLTGGEGYLHLWMPLIRGAGVPQSALLIKMPAEFLYSGAIRQELTATSRLIGVGAELIEDPPARPGSQTCRPERLLGLAQSLACEALPGSLADRTSHDPHGENAIRSHDLRVLIMMRFLLLRAQSPFVQRVSAGLG